MLRWSMRSFWSALVAALALVLAVAVPAQAVPSLPGGPMTIEIHKYEQPDQLGQPGTGLPLDDPGSIGTDPVPGATFTATAVPGIDVSTNEGRAAASKLTPQQAAVLIAESQPAIDPAATAVTDDFGDATLGNLPLGLYYVQETVIPSGYVKGAPFLVMLPMSHPVIQNQWLTTVHVYPKNAPIAITLDVDDQAAVTLGDTVHWASTSDIPLQPSLTSYTVTQRIDPALDLICPDSVTVSLTPSGEAFREGTDYTLTCGPDGRSFTVDFTAVGLGKLMSAVQAHPGAMVKISYDTTVRAMGQLTNTAELTVNGAAPVSDTATTKWGPLKVEVYEKGNPTHLIPGAKVKLYLTPEDALAGRNAITVNGVDEWTTDHNGQLVIEGLRFSTFVNGLDREKNDPLYREYFVMPTFCPDGWQGDMNPVAVQVTSVSQPMVVEIPVWKNSPAPTPTPVPSGKPTPPPTKHDPLPITGAQIAGLTLGSVVLLTVGGMLLVSRRRDRREETSSS